MIKGNSMIPRNHNEILGGHSDNGDNDTSSSLRHFVVDDPFTFMTSLSFGWENFAPPLRDVTMSSSGESVCSPEYDHTVCKAGRSNLRTKDSTQLSNKRSRTTKPHKSVSFSNLAIREYGVIVGDNPSARSLPITLSWAHTEEPRIYDIDSYEETRTGRRRRGEGIRMSYVEKRLLLREHGIKEEDIRHAQHVSNVNEDRARPYSFAGQSAGAVGGNAPNSSTIRRVKTLAILQRPPSE